MPRMTRRAVLAAIALAPVPVPEVVKFNDGSRAGSDGRPLDSSITIDLGDDMQAFREWCAFLGVEEQWIRHQTFTPAAHGQTGEPFEIWNAVAWDQWGYRQTELHADELITRAVDEPLPADRVTALGELVDEREADA